MNRAISNLLTFACILAFGRSGLPQPARASSVDLGLSINVHVFNYAELPPKTLQHAEDVAAQIFREARVEATWRNCNPVLTDIDHDVNCTQKPSPTNLVLKILPDIAVTPGFTHDTTMGFAIGAYASVSFRRVRKEAALMGATPCEILGFSAAHELGHLLLGSGSHSDRGIMRPSWRREDFGVSPQGAFKFTAEQAQSIRTEVGKRAQEQAAEPIPRITVRMHDYAGVSRDTLDRAEGEMARIFEVAGIATTWVDCPLTTSELPQYPACLQPADSPRFDMNIVPRFMATRYAMHETALGFTSFAREGEHNSVASVFYDRVRETAESTPMSSPRLLAHAMAHELGHLLLRTSGHTPGGIMRARWTPDDLRLASCGRLLFTAEQAQLIRAEVWARRAQQEDAASGLVATQK